MGLIIGGTIVGTILTPEFPRTHYYNTANSLTKSDHRQDKSLWIPDDSTSFFALWTAVFTCVLAFSTILLWNETANNAQIAERALTEHERPWLFLESASVKMRDPETMTVVRNNWFIKLHFKNVGRMPAIVTDFICKIAEMNTLGPMPDYQGGFQLPVQRTISVGEVVESGEVGPAPTTENQRGAELVFFGCITYSELGGKQHKTGFALRVSPYMPAAVPYQNRNYDYYD
jgi:hypothetical protein